jgi:hypothetical protein
VVALTRNQAHQFDQRAYLDSGTQAEAACDGGKRNRSFQTKKRWFRNGQKWRAGCEGRISVVKRRHGLDRSRCRGDAGMQRWVGLGVIADNLVNISRVMAKQPGQ